MRKSFFILLSLWIFPATVFANTDQDWIYQAQEALKPFKMELKAELKKAFAEGGPVQAVQACKMKAPEIAKRNQAKGISLGRTSHKLRNPENKPEEWMTRFFAIWKKTNGRNPGQPMLLTLEDETKAYVEPIYVDGLCLQCHGTAIDSNVEDLLKKEYPEDQARGFKQNDFRGIFWVKIKAKE